MTDVNKNQISLKLLSNNVHDNSNNNNDNNNIKNNKKYPNKPSSVSFRLQV
jgi:hypothetical protein